MSEDNNPADDTKDVFPPVDRKCDYCEDNVVTDEDKKACKQMGINAMLCADCLGEYDNKTGHCSLQCCISGCCDESC